MRPTSLMYLTVWLFACDGQGSGPLGNTSSPCSADEFRGPGGRCEALTVCGSDEFESGPPSGRIDRRCEAVTICKATQYEARAPTPTSNRDCRRLTTCTAFEFEARAPTPTHDRDCARFTTCDANEYELTAATATSDRVCTELTDCDTDEHEVKRPTETSDRGCAPNADGGCPTGQFMPTSGPVRQCTPVTVCRDDEYEVSPPALMADRVCRRISHCGQDYYEFAAPTATSDRTCTALTVCLETEEEVVPPTPTTDRVCRDRCAEVTCTPSDTCHSSECNSLTGQCQEDVLAGEPCDDGSPETIDSCTNEGDCIGLPDRDHDGYASSGVAVSDCDDERFSVNPGRTEVCRNGLDDDCDSETSDVDCDANPCPSGDCGPGCADGTREGYTKALLYPGIAACGGGWSVPGVFQEHLPTCDRLAGDDSANPAGTGCATSDLCASGWHVCRTALEVLTFSEGAGCGPATVAETFFVTGQSGNGCGYCSVSSDPADSGCSGGSCLSSCYPTSVQANDIFGCGAIGITPAGNCTPLNSFGNNFCASLPSPWACSAGSNTVDEALWVTKSGSAGGGVLCCVD